MHERIITTPESDKQSGVYILLSMEIKVLDIIDELIKQGITGEQLKLEKEKLWENFYLTI